MNRIIMSPETEIPRRYLPDSKFFSVMRVYPERYNEYHIKPKKKDISRSHNELSMLYEKIEDILKENQDDTEELTDSTKVIKCVGNDFDSKNTYYLYCQLKNSEDIDEDFQKIVDQLDKAYPSVKILMDNYTKTLSLKTLILNRFESIPFLMASEYHFLNKNKGITLDAIKIISKQIEDDMKRKN